jgi:hypothetical protein
MPASVSVIRLVVRVNSGVPSSSSSPRISSVILDGLIDSRTAAREKCSCCAAANALGSRSSIALSTLPVALSSHDYSTFPKSGSHLAS